MKIFEMNSKVHLKVNLVINFELSLDPTTLPPTPASASAIMNGGGPKLSQIIANSNIELNPSLVNLSMSSLSNLSSGRSQEYILESSQENLLETPMKSVKHLRKLDKDTRISSLASSRSSLSTVKYVYIIVL